ncbi:MAG: histidine kinase N-terminal 7TM domain-containing protein [Chloroflexota bacterium]
MLILIAGIYGLLGLYGWRHRVSSLAWVFTWLMLSLGLWSLGYGLEIYSQSLVMKVFWGKVEYPGIVSGPVLWLLFALAYTGQWQWLTRSKWIGLWLIPTVTLILFWTNESHHLVWKSVTLAHSGDLLLLAPQYGPWFGIFVFYSYACLLVGSGITIIGAWRSPPLYRAQALTTVIAVIFPLLGNVVYVFSGGDLDLTPFLFFPSSIALAWAIARFRLLDVVPPAQNVILQNLQDGIILLDRDRRVLYMNTAAESIFSAKSNESLGLSFEVVCAECSAKIVPLLGLGEKIVEGTLSVHGVSRQFEIRVLPMAAGQRSAREAASHLIIFHDVTENRQVVAALERRDTILRVVNLVAGQFLTSSEWEQNVPQVLERLGDAARASRVYIFESFLSETGMPLVSQRYEWTAAGVEPQIDNAVLQNLAWREAGFTRWEDAFENGQIISGQINDFPDVEKELLISQGILTIAVVPIFLEGKLWGFIGFDDCLRERDWTEVELGALRAAADIFSAALTRRNIELDLMRRQHSQELLQDIIRAALGKSTLTEMAQVLVDNLGNFIGADHCFLSRWDEDREMVVNVAAYGVPLDDYLNVRVLPGEKNLIRSALEAGQMLVVHDAQDSPHVSRRLAEIFQTRSVLVIPMISNETKLGAVLLGFSKLHQFTSEEIILSEQAAELITLAFAKTLAVEESHRRYEESETLRRAGSTVAETLNLQEATTRLLEQLAFVVPHDSASVQLLRTGELEIIGGEGWTDPSTVIGTRFPIPGNNPNTRVIETRQPLLLNDPHEIYPDFRIIKHAAHIRSWLGVPLIVHNQIIGLLAIDSREVNHFSQDDIQLASTFASQVAVAIENARLFDEVQQLAITDGLTGLYNRRYFMELAQSEFERARRYKRHLSAMMFDIDHFKKVNDTCGHPFGDMVLQKIAGLCKEKLREADPIARYGGEEFIALIVEAGGKHAKMVGERLRKEVEKMVTQHEKADIRVTVSVGIAEMNNDTPTIESLIARADQALYVAKHKGRNSVIVGH